MRRELDHGLAALGVLVAARAYGIVSLHEYSKLLSEGSGPGMSLCLPPLVDGSAV